MPALAFKHGAESAKTESPLACVFTEAILGVTGSPFSHVEFWLDGPPSSARCFSAREFTQGVEWATLDLTNPLLWTVVPLPALTDYQLISVPAFCNGNVGRDYDSEGILGILRDTGWHSGSDRFCSEMCFDIGQQVLGWRQDIVRWHVAPGWTKGGDRYGLYELATGGRLHG